MGAVVGVAVCEPDVDADEFGQKSTTTTRISPSVRAKDISITPNISATVDLVPDMDVDGVGVTPVVLSTFPPPRVN